MSGHLLTQWAQLLMAQLAAAGVHEVVVGPGSRSTAFVLAAEAHPGLEVHRAIDERAGGFFALGIGRATRRPALFLCTSGTAIAHTFPAVIEATRSRIPLLVMSADRPLELVDCEAPQTIDQVKLFGDHVVSYVELGTPDPHLRALRGLARKAYQAVLASQWPVAGAVHLNARARKPFEPSPASTAAEQALEAQVRDLMALRPTVSTPQAQPNGAHLDELAQLIARTPNGVILAGPAPVQARAYREALASLAQRTGYPVLAEASSQQRFGLSVIRHFDLFLGVPSHRESLRPSLVLQVGAPLVAGSYEGWLEEHEPPRALLAEWGWPDWLGTASHLVLGDLATSLQGLAARVPVRPHSEWLDRWNDLDHFTGDVVRSQTERAPHSEAAAVSALIPALPAGTQLMVGNSLAIRLVDWVGSEPSEAVDVLCQRGANGIDGLIAGAAGSVVATGRPCTLLLGDVAALHDLNGLLMVAHLPAALVVVVLANGGGRIFDLLPVAHHDGVSANALGHLTTPHHHQLEGAASTYGITYRTCHADELAETLLRAQHGRGCTLIEVPVEPNGAAAWLRRVREALA